MIGRLAMRAIIIWEVQVACRKSSTEQASNEANRRRESRDGEIRMVCENKRERGGKEEILGEAAAAETELVRPFSPKQTSTMMKILPLLLLGAVGVHAFVPASQSAAGVGAFAPASQSAASPHALRMSSTVEEDTAVGANSDSFLQDDDETELTSKGLLKRDRYVATNRFAVRPGKEAKFEKRWATRKSRLASLDGFRYFHLMRRVTLNDDGSSTYDGGDKKDETNMGNYVSFTVWEKKSHFSAWRKGDAFKVGVDSCACSYSCCYL